MLKYFVDTTEALISAGLLVGLLYFYLSSGFGKKGKVFALVCLLAGLAGAGTVAYLKNGTKLLTSSKWNEIVMILFFIAIGCAGAVLDFLRTPETSQTGQPVGCLPALPAL